MNSKVLCVAVFISMIFAGSADVFAKEIREVVIFGNSIRKKAPAKELGWTGDWGMAATGKDKDYVHILYKKICDKLAKTQKEPPKLRWGGNVRESDFLKYDVGQVKEADVIIVQLGDNCFGNSVETFQKPYEAMIRDFKNVRGAILICVSNWGGGKHSEMIEAAAQNQGAKFVPIYLLQRDPQNSAKSEGHFTNTNVNWHPGDRGMKAIAEAIWEVLEPELDKAAAVSPSR
ncbi:MAG: hypothetical protein BWY31_04381 [Lentisphaerae bacterium ADurb.Bin242]|nr:MAG: hypothetical protein BWY31_04381 [Lentisphaerae bacterium ADurb.Bin242]